MPHAWAADHSDGCGEHRAEGLALSVRLCCSFGQASPFPSPPPDFCEVAALMGLSSAMRGARGEHCQKGIGQLGSAGWSALFPPEFNDIPGASTKPGSAYVAEQQLASRAEPGGWLCSCMSKVPS